MHEYVLSQLNRRDRDLSYFAALLNGCAGVVSGYVKSVHPGRTRFVFCFASLSHWTHECTMSFYYYRKSRTSFLSF